MKVIRGISCVIVGILISASTAAYVGECIMGGKVDTCCSRDDRCSDECSENRIESVKTNLGEYGTRICHLELSEIWRDSAVDLDETPVFLSNRATGNIEPAKRKLRTVAYELPIGRNPTISYLKTVILLI